MSNEDLAKRLEDRFAAWPEQDALFHCEVGPDEKFRAIVKRQYEKAVGSLGGPAPRLPSFVRKRLQAGIPWVQDPPALFSLEGRLGKTQWARVTKKHAQKREKALLCLADEGFSDDLMSLARTWGLDTNYYLVTRDSFYPGCPLDGRMPWRTELLWRTGEYLLEHEAERAASERASALQYAQDLDFGALGERHLASMLAPPVRRFEFEIGCFTQKHGLGPQWEPSIEALLLCGWLFVPLEDCRAVYRWEDLRSRLLLEVFAETRQEDLVAKWQEVRKLWSELFPGQPGRQRRRPRVERDVRARASMDAGRSLEEIFVGDLDGGSLDWDKQGKAFEALKRAASRLPAAQAKALRAAANPRAPSRVICQMIADERRRKEWHF
jgi:hypothetical protein